MIKITAKIDGMMCGMCESHINDAIRAAFPVKKVSSSHTKNRTVILTEDSIDGERLKSVIDGIGYTLVSAESEPYEKKKLFSGFRK